MRSKLSFSPLFRAVAVVLVALVALSVAFARQPRQDGGLRKSTEDAKAREAAKQQPAKPAKPSKANPQADPAPGAPAKPAPKTAPPPPPSAKQRSADPLERVKEDLQEAKAALNKGEILKAYREANAVVKTIETQKYDRLGVDGKGTKAEEFRQTLSESLKVAKESGERLNRANVNSAKPLTFYF
ncbi:MAG: hypothetical protein IKX88_12120 [Thermoguttaceae bacterium]|nr:hypothetical protein [Thermoguttaceae bacterium]